MISLSKYGNERDIEIPFVLEHVRGPLVLDVGKDKVGYTQALEDMGYTVEACDPDPNSGATYSERFEECWPTQRYDTVLFLSSLEHFVPTVQNMLSLESEIYCVCKARLLLKEHGVLIITVPFGEEKLHGDFIQWSPTRLWMIKQAVKANLIVEQYAKWRGANWVACEPVECEGVAYHANRAGGAGAVYMGVWQ